MAAPLLLIPVVKWGSVALIGGGAFGLAKGTASATRDLFVLAAVAGAGYYMWRRK